MTRESQSDPATSPDENEPQNPKPPAKPGKTGILKMSGDSEPMQVRTPTSGIKPIQDNWVIRFEIAKDTVRLPVNTQILIGRASSDMPDESDDDVTLDLAPYGAYQYGVSRRHAQIMLLNQVLYIEDLNSTNGTRINGFQLTPRQRYLLRDGDEIEFARLAVNLFLEEPT